jgi:dTDP-4-amino-4,6-dideoxygalactose transaminase
MMSKIPVMRPKLPVAERLAGYLRRIDASRLYTNFGPLCIALEDQLAAHYGLGTGRVTTVANATQGLALTLAALGARPGTHCIMPAWTFVASAHAAVSAGLVPYFMDVDRDSWLLDASAVADEITRAGATVGAVMPVAPFGQPVDFSAWEVFHEKTGIPVVIDAAAGFDSLIPARVPAVVSLHATKVLGTGEGGFVACTDPAVIRRVRMASNFGLNPNRQAMVAATNAKMSEYHAAVGHAALDEWAETRAEWMAVAGAYRGALGDSNRVRFQHGFGETWVSSTCVLHTTDGAAAKFENALATVGIETRHWWGHGAHTHPATTDFPRSALPVVETLANSAFGVPFFRDLSLADVERIGKVMLADVH